MSNYNDFEVVGTKHQQPISQKQFIDKFTNLTATFDLRSAKATFTTNRALLIEKLNISRRNQGTVLISEEVSASGMRILECGEDDDVSPGMT